MSKEEWEDIVKWANEEQMSIETVAQAGPLTFLGIKIPKGFGYLETDAWAVSVVSRHAYTPATGNYDGEVYWFAEWKLCNSRVKISVGHLRDYENYKTPQEALNALGEELACLSKTLDSMQEWKLP